MRRKEFEAFLADLAEECRLPQKLLIAVLMSARGERLAERVHLAVNASRELTGGLPDHWRTLIYVFCAVNLQNLIECYEVLYWSD